MMYLDLDGQDKILIFLKEVNMEKHDFKKKYGQNFLNNEEILNSILKLVNVKSDEEIVEVGPGAGALTKKLLTKNVHVTCFEIDESLKKFLDKIDNKNLNVIYTDFLEIKLCDYFKNSDKLYFIANIPYYITTPIITKFIDEKFIPKCMILMVQNEVALRLSSKPHSSEYGAITVILNYFFDIDYKFLVERNNFYPIPNVDSAISELSKKDKILDLKNYDTFLKIVYDAFKHKRKNLRNNLKNYDLVNIEIILNKYGMNLQNRAEDISYEIFVEIANIL